MVISQLKSTSGIEVLNVWATVNGQLVASQSASLGQANPGNYDLSMQTPAQLSLTAMPTDQVALGFQIVNVAAAGEAAEVFSAGRQILQASNSSAWVAIQNASASIQPPFTGCEGFLAADKFGAANISDLATMTGGTKTYVSSSQMTPAGCSLSNLQVTFSFA